MSSSTIDNDLLDNLDSIDFTPKKTKIDYWSDHWTILPVLSTDTNDIKIKTRTPLWYPGFYFK